LARSDLLEIEAMIRSLAKQGSDNQQIACFGSVENGHQGDWRYSKTKTAAKGKM
jgi:hypothetical protein